MNARHDEVAARGARKLGEGHTGMTVEYNGLDSALWPERQLLV
jgi:hypothetical protein